ncbi:MAG: GNAT family N-acetyltransferase [Planctomycetota bacterium]|jgi:ribosomal protein S18 acetylase RimI-like enzyme
MTEDMNSPQPREMTLDDLDGITGVHRKCFPGSISIFTPLDDNILKRYYAQAVVESESFVAVLEEPDSRKIIGLAIGTTKPGFQRRFLRRNFSPFILSIIKAFIVNPIVRKAVWERFKVIKRVLLGRRKTELANLGVPAPKGPEAFLLLIGVREQWRGGGNSERLIEYFTTRMFREGVGRIRGAVSPDNLASLILHKRVGWSVKKIFADEVSVWIDRPNSNS